LTRKKKAKKCSGKKTNQTCETVQQEHSRWKDQDKEKLIEISCVENVHKTEKHGGTVDSMETSVDL
jgi:hypothetical protein